MPGAGSLEMFRNQIRASQWSVTKVPKLTAFYNICGRCSGDGRAASKPIPDPAGPGHLLGAAGMMRGAVVAESGPSGAWAPSGGGREDERGWCLGIGGVGY